MRIPLRNLFSSMPNLRYILGAFGAANRGQASVDDHLCTIVGFSSRTRKGLANSRQGAGDSSKTRSATVNARSFCDQLDESDAHSHQFPFSMVSYKTSWTLENWNSAPLQLSNNVWPLKDTRILPTLTMNAAPRGGKLLINTAGFPFKGVDMTRAEIRALISDLLVVAIV